MQNYFYLLPPYVQNGTVESFCAKYGGLNEYLYSNLLWIWALINCIKNKLKIKLSNFIFSIRFFLLDKNTEMFWAVDSPLSKKRSHFSHKRLAQPRGQTVWNDDLNCGAHLKFEFCAINLDFEYENVFWAYELNFVFLLQLFNI